MSACSEGAEKEAVIHEEYKLINLVYFETYATDLETATAPLTYTETLDLTKLSFTRMGYDTTSMNMTEFDTNYKALDTSGSATLGNMNPSKLRKFIAKNVGNQNQDFYRL